MEKILSKVRILFITSNLGIGGLERVIVQLCLHLDKKIFIPAVCCIHFKGDLSQQLEKNCIPVYSLNLKKPDYLAFMKIISVISEFKPHIVHTHNINASIDGVIASVIKMVPVIIHTDHARKFPDKKRYMFAESVISHFIDRIIAVSEETKLNLIKFENIKKSKIEVINNGVDSSSFNMVWKRDLKRNELRLNEFRFVIGTAVRLERQKGLIHLIKAFTLVLQKYPDSVLVIAGKGSQKEELLQEVNKHSIENNVRFIGPRLDLDEILPIFDVYVLPSEWEGLPMALLEAMACRLPIVATNVGGIPMAVNNGECGILVKPGSYKELADGICFLLNDSSLRGKLAVAARKKYEESFTIQEMIKNHQNLYLEYLKRHGLKNARTDS